MDARRLYHRSDEWLRGLSRGPYAAVTGLLTGVAVLAVSALLGDPLPFQAAIMALAMTVVYYAFDLQ